MVKIIHIKDAREKQCPFITFRANIKVHCQGQYCMMWVKGKYSASEGYCSIREGMKAQAERGIDERV